MATESYRWKDTKKTTPTWKLVTADGKSPTFKGNQMEVVVFQSLGSERYFWKIATKESSRTGGSKTKEEAFALIEKYMKAMNDTGEFFGKRHTARDFQSSLARTPSEKYE